MIIVTRKPHKQQVKSSEPRVLKSNMNSLWEMPVLSSPPFHPDRDGTHALLRAHAARYCISVKLLLWITDGNCSLTSRK